MQPFASQHTPSFAQFLREAGVSLVISTYQAGQLVLIRAQGEGVNTHFMAMTNPTGIAIERGRRLSVGDAHRIESFRNLPAVGRKVEDGDFDAAYVHRSTHVSGDIDVHEMGYDDSGQLWLINTRMSCLCTLDPDFSVVPRWKPPFISRYDLLDRCHLNGLGFRDGKPRYVSMLGDGDEPGSWRRNKASGGLIIDLADDSVVAEGLCMPHSPRWHRDRLWFLSSGEGSLNRVEADGRIVSVVELPGFTRGLEFFGRYALVGLSQVRETAVFAGLPLTRRVAERRCGVYLIDIETAAIVALLHFVGEVREIFDLRVLAHRKPILIDAESPLLATSFELPEAALRWVAEADPLLERLAEASRLHAEGRLDEAINGYRGVLADRSALHVAQQRLGLALVDAERWQEARDALLEALRSDADDADACNGLGLCHARLLEHEAALHGFDRALEIDRQFALAHFNRALILLKLGHYAEGWAEYEWRWQLPSFTPFRCPQPRWRGEAIADQRLLVHSEQGHGDQIQFWRFLRAARARCRELIYVGPESLAELAAGIEGVDESRVAGEIARDRFDCFVPLMSLPACLGLSRDDLGVDAPYLNVPEHVAVRRLEGSNRVGFAWRGNALQEDDHRRSMRLAQWTPLLAQSHIRAFSFQFGLGGDEAEQLRAQAVVNLDAEIAGFSRCAAFAAQMDLVITVDTAMAHLAGAMGLPVWILLASDADWRWGIAGESTPWYAQARLFRQAPGESWTALIARVEAALHDWNADSGNGLR